MNCYGIYWWMKFINGLYYCSSINSLNLAMEIFCEIILDLENELSRIKEVSEKLPEQMEYMPSAIVKLHWIECENW